MSTASHHAEWLSLLEISGPFLSMPVLLRVFPQGLDSRDARQAAELRAAYEEWIDNQQGLRPDPAIHRAWVEYVLADLLGLGKEVLHPFDRLTPDERRCWSVAFPEHGETLQPDYVLLHPPGRGNAAERRARLLVQVLPANRTPEQAPSGSPWAASAAARMQELLHASGVRLGLITNGEQWMLVDAPQGQTTGYISWYAELWFDEPLTLRAFTTLLSAYRFFGVPEAETLEALLAESVNNQQEVTDQLGRQVRHAVELLIQAMDRADQDADRSLLAGLPMPDLYRASVTVMMRLVFLLSAEERGLLPLDDELYSAHYAVSTLHGQLRAMADQTGEEVLEYRHDAWPRLLAVFRAVHGGVYHDRWHMPAYGGTLFDPSIFPFLEGIHDRPLKIDNRTVLHLLESLQYLAVDVPGGSRQTRRLSFRALDIEQIGHVYEGLLDHTAQRAAGPVVGLQGTKDKEPEIALDELEGYLPAGRTLAEFDDWPAAQQKRLIDFLKDRTGRSVSALRRGVTAPPPDLMRSQALRMAAHNDDALYARLLPWHGLLRDDDYGRPVVIPAGSVYVTSGAERRATGTHYTPRSLTEPIVQHTLEPLVYIGPAEGKPRDQWTLRPPHELLAIKVCDMAMGSGAFLVQACRYLAERLVEAVDTETRPPAQAEPSALAALRQAADLDERLLLARRLVASRCLYGVDKNALAVEMAKLSIWLITLDKQRPFTFLDHALKCGDSLVGVDLDQLRRWSLEAAGTAPTDALHLDLDIERMVRLRREIEEMPTLDIRDQQAKAYKLAQAEAIAHDLKAAGDMLIASYYNTLPKPQQENLRAALLESVRSGADLEERWQPHADLGDLTPFHWPLEFPEVFLAEGRSGFDAFVGNPPFIGGQRIRSSLGGEYLQYLKTRWDHARGSADYCAYFFLRAYEYLRPQGCSGLIATNTIAQGDTRELGLDHIAQLGGTIYRAHNDYPWPGSAAVVVNIVHLCKGTYSGELTLDDRKVAHISPLLDDTKTSGNPFALAANVGKSFQGSNVLGLGFTMPPEEAAELIARNPRNQDVLFPYLNGEDLNSSPEQTPSRWVINFFDWPLERNARPGWFEADERQRQAWLRTGIVPSDYPDPVAADYPDCLAIVREKVYPERSKNRDRQRREIWWRFTRPTIELYATIAPLQQVLVVPVVSKYVSFVFVQSTWVYAHRLVVFPFNSHKDFGVLQSFIYEPWARQYSSTLETRINYSPTDCFDNFPFPAVTQAEHQLLSTAAQHYDDHRHAVMLDRWEGLTTTYNRFHDPGETAADIARLRQLHVEMDYAVAAAYGWPDLDLGHAFHETPQGIRYTISEPARRTVLARLLELNHARYAEEVKAGLHDKKKGKSKRSKKAVANEQMSIFE